MAEKDVNEDCDYDDQGDCLCVLPTVSSSRLLVRRFMYFDRTLIKHNRKGMTVVVAIVTAVLLLLVIL